MPTSREIRQQYIDFFVAKHGHAFVPSSPVVPHDDPTLLFANAGMNQFKPYFLGTEQPEHARVANTQKCIRAGGKHNDLEDVGKDTYHHTFFEMLGNWSFGDYFKKEAIAWAWELLTGVWGMDKSRLHVTVFEGDTNEDLAPDREAAALWQSETDIDPSHIHMGNKKDNFWEMGDTGPCGPCSEIHIDLTPDKSGAKLVNAGDARVIEIWNLVFIQFNRNQAGLLTPLPAKHVDTGMGFERLCRVLQGVDSNYATDVFAPIFRAIHEVTGVRPYGGDLHDHVDIAYRVIADHVRCLTFALTDSAVPSNEGRGYVLRRILRRAVRHGWQTLGLHEPFLHRLVPGVVDAMGDVFPELRKNPQRVIDLIKDEEQSFARTLDRGIALFEEAAARSRLAGDAQRPSQIAAEDAFKLHDTYGFPLDLTQVMAEERGMSVDVAGFKTLMDKARQQARAGGGEQIDLRAQLVDLVQKGTVKPGEFVGYDVMACDVTVQAIYFAGTDGQLHQHNHDDAHVFMVTDRTPFYAEAGGQVGDVGTAAVGEAQLAITDTFRIGDVIFHEGKLTCGAIKPGDKVTLSVDATRRQRIMANHTITHVMNHKLRAVLGDHVAQKGSLVNEDRTRFDFAHTAALGDAQITQVEALVNTDIDKDLPVHAHVAPQEEALKIHGLRAVFGEKYPPRVRIVTIGKPAQEMLKNPGDQGWYDYSVEFCGGTHLPSTGVAKRFVIVSEEAVGKGVRRVTAITGEAAEKAQSIGSELLKRVESLKAAPAEQLHTEVAEVSDVINQATLPLDVRTKLREGISELQRIIKEAQKERGRESTGEVVEIARRIADEADGNLIVRELPGLDAEGLRTAMDVIRKKRPEAALLLGAANDDKVAFIAAVPPELIKKGLKAGDWVREVAKVAGGGGGGRPDMAQAGGKDPAKLAEALEVGRNFAYSQI